MESSYFEALTDGALAPGHEPAALWPSPTLCAPHLRISLLMRLGFPGSCCGGVLGTLLPTGRRACSHRSCCQACLLLPALVNRMWSCPSPSIPVPYPSPTTSWGHQLRHRCAQPLPGFAADTSCSMGRAGSRGCWHPGACKDTA